MKWKFALATIFIRNKRYEIESFQVKPITKASLCAARPMTRRQSAELAMSELQRERQVHVCVCLRALVFDSVCAFNFAGPIHGINATGDGAQ